MYMYWNVLDPLSELAVNDLIFNPRCTCAVRVTLLVLCVCLSLCLLICRFFWQDYTLKGR